MPAVGKKMHWRGFVVKRVSLPKLYDGNKLTADPTRVSKRILN
jgi:hypothetical protein